MASPLGPSMHTVPLWVNFRRKSCGCIWTILERRQHAGQDFQAQVFLVSQSVCTSLDDADLVVQPFNETKRNFVLFITDSVDRVSSRSSRPRRANSPASSQRS